VEVPNRLGAELAAGPPKLAVAVAGAVRAHAKAFREGVSYTGASFDSEMT